MWLSQNLCLRISQKTAIKFHLKQDSFPTQSVVAGSSSWDVGFRASVLYRLLAAGSPRFLDIWACPKRQFSSSGQQETESLLARPKTRPFVINQKSAILSWLLCFVSYRQVTRSSPHSRVADHTGCEHPEVGIIGVHFRNLSVTTAQNPHSLPKLKICFGENSPSLTAIFTILVEQR